jgi:mono/diheme cytochrome c family protein
MFVMAGLVLLILSGCAKYQIPVDCPEGTTGVSYSGDIQPIFNSECISCHGGSQAPDLSDGWSYEELIDGGYVAEADVACESSLYTVFSGTHEGRLSEEDLLMVLGWIQDGAPEN